MNRTEIPSLEKPGYPKPASFDTVADYGGVRFIKDFSNVKAGAWGTATERYGDCCDVWITDGPRVNNVPYECLEASNLRSANLSGANLRAYLVATSKWLND